MFSLISTREQVLANKAIEHTLGELIANPEDLLTWNVLSDALCEVGREGQGEATRLCAHLCLDRGSLVGKRHDTIVRLSELRDKGYLPILPSSVRSWNGLHLSFNLIPRNDGFSTWVMNHPISNELWDELMGPSSYSGAPGAPRKGFSFNEMRNGVPGLQNFLVRILKCRIDLPILADIGLMRASGLLRNWTNCLNKYEVMESEVEPPQDKILVFTYRHLWNT